MDDYYLDRSYLKPEEEKNIDYEDINLIDIELFNKHFGKCFKLATKSEFETEYLHAEQSVRFIGDFVAMATDKYQLLQDRNCLLLKSNHAGITPDELEIPIIKINRLIDCNFII